MNPVIMISLCVFWVAVFLIAAALSEVDTTPRLGEESAPDDTDSQRHRTPPDGSGAVDSLDTSADVGTRVGDHVVTTMSDGLDFDSFSDWPDASGGHDDW